MRVTDASTSFDRALWASCDADEQSPGQRAYERYRLAVGGKTFDGKPMLEFGEMPERIRAGWEAAADTGRDGR